MSANGRKLTPVAWVTLPGIGGVALAQTSGINTVDAAGLFLLAMAWLLTAAMAPTAIRKKNFLQHKEWMIRSYVVTFAFVTFRVLDDLLAHYGVGEQSDRLTLMSWACWTVPLLFTELVLQGKKVFRAQASRFHQPWNKPNEATLASPLLSPG